MCKNVVQFVVLLELITAILSYLKKLYQKHFEVHKMPNTSIIPFLKEQLNLPLPGQEAQRKMATKTRLSFNQKTTSINARLASVLCLLYPKKR